MEKVQVHVDYKNINLEIKHLSLVNLGRWKWVYVFFV